MYLLALNELVPRQQPKKDGNDILLIKTCLKLIIDNTDKFVYKYNCTVERVYGTMNARYGVQQVILAY